MKEVLFIIVINLCAAQIVKAQSGSRFAPKIEPCECIFKADTSLITECGYLLVPENRTNAKSNIIRLPFVFVKSKNSAKKKDPVLFTTGGPGGSSIQAVESIHHFNFIKERDFIAFEQRGTKYTLPCLECKEVNTAVKTAYIHNLSKDSLTNIAVSQCRKRLLKKGIDITGYTTSESTDDIEDLRKLLKIDSLNLIGISYSGGLMLNVLRKYPKHIRSLILDSPLPLWVNIDEDELANFNEALHQVFVAQNNVALEENLKDYLTALADKRFLTDYVDTILKKAYKISYGRKELLDIIGSKISKEEGRKSMPQLINDLIKGNHRMYIDEYLTNVINDNSEYSAMRLSVYCSDKMAYANKSISRQQSDIYLSTANYNPNDVSFEMCESWNVPSMHVENKMAFYSNTPMLLGAGRFDPACRPVYNDLLYHYFPKSQRLLFENKAHGPLISLEGNQFIADFLNNPMKKIVVTTNNIKIY